MSKSQSISQLGIRTYIHDMDEGIQRKLNHIRKDFSYENVRLVEDYLNAIKLDACGKIVQNQHLQYFLKMTPVLSNNGKNATKGEIPLRIGQFGKAFSEYYEEDVGKGGKW